MSSDLSQAIIETDVTWPSPTILGGYDETRLEPVFFNIISEKKNSNALFSGDAFLLFIPWVCHIFRIRKVKINTVKCSEIIPSM